ncbi:transmembrane protein 116 [Brachionichthys hirsutus]|uniref:transmembrane protein 116 n=1 Tax=Brachionichthys hirsutus TaxID=412623 RepID=UPI0036044C7B
MVRWRHLNKEVHLLVQLALADLLAALILMYTSAINKVNTDNSVTICQYSLPLSLTFYLISFLLVVVYAWRSKRVVQGWRTRHTEDEGIQNPCRNTTVTTPVCAMVWSIPITMYLAYVLTPFITTTVLIPNADTTLRERIHNESKYCTSCILFLHIWSDSCSDAEIIHDTLTRVFLLIVVIPLMVSCFIIYYKVGKWHKRHEQEGLFPVEGDGRSRRRIKRVFSTARNMIMVILFCWTPVLLLSNLMFWTNIKQHTLFGLYAIQVASVSLQGFLNSMVYAWRRPNFTEVIFGESTPLVAYGHLAFFDESLRSTP